MFDLWIAWRYIARVRGRFFNMTSSLAVVGMALSVAALVIVMGVISGFETTLRNAVVDVTGHLHLIKRGEPIFEPMDTFIPKLKKIVPAIESVAPFVHVEGMIAHRGRIAGVGVEGFEPQSVGRTLNLRDRIVDGKFDLGTGLERVPPIVIGKGLAKKLQIKIGDEINVILPKNSPSSKVTGFKSVVKKFKVVGLIDLGMYQYDTRFLITSAKAAQDLGGIGPYYLGVRIKLTDPNLAADASFKLSTELSQFVSRDWMESNYNLFSAIKLEKVVIFIVVLFITIAACFNIASTLFISVLRRFGDISILKTLGATQFRLMKFFTLQGLAIGFVGTTLGIFLGLVISFIIAKTNIIYVPPEVYHLSRLPIEIRFVDLGLVILASMLLCFVATLAPARRGAKLNPIEGLRYD